MRKRSSPSYTGNRLGPATKVFVRLLADGPRVLEDVVIEAAKAVPPGQAKRRFERMERVENPVYEPPPLDLQSASGGRWIVLASVRGLAITGKVRFYENGMTEMVALTDEGRRALLGESNPQPAKIDPSWREIRAYTTTDKRYALASGGPDADDTEGTT